MGSLEALTSGGRPRRDHRAYLGCRERGAPYAASPRMRRSVWWPLGIVLAAVHFVFAYRLFFRGQHGPNLSNV